MSPCASGQLLRASTGDQRPTWSSCSRSRSQRLPYFSSRPSVDRVGVSSWEEMEPQGSRISSVLAFSLDTRLGVKEKGPRHKCCELVTPIYGVHPRLYAPTPRRATLALGPLAPSTQRLCFHSFLIPDTVGLHLVKTSNSNKENQ